MSDYIIQLENSITRVTRDGRVFFQQLKKMPLVRKERKFSGEFFSEKWLPERERKTRVNNRGYLSVCFNKTTYMVHKLVAQGFCPNPDKKQFVNHIDGNKLNNHADNLEWCTIAENNHHARTTGLHKQAKGHKIHYASPASKAKALANLQDNTKLSQADVEFIRCNIQLGVRGSEYNCTNLADRFGVSTYTIYAVLREKTHKVLK